MSYTNMRLSEDGIRLERVVDVILRELNAPIIHGEEKLVNLVEYSKHRFRGVDFVLNGGVEIEVKNHNPKNQLGKSFFITRRRLCFSKRAKCKLLIIPAGVIYPDFAIELKRMKIEVIDSIHKLERGDPDYDYIKDNIKRQLIITLKRLKMKKTPSTKQLTLINQY